MVSPPAVVQLLIERNNVEINAKDNGENTALIWAAYHGREAVVRLLIDVEINAKDDVGKSALILAAEYGHEPIARLINDRLESLDSDIAL